MATTEKGIYYPDDYTKPADVPEDMKKLAESVDTVVSNLDTNKVDKVEGKGLSTNDYTNEDKAKLDSLENYDDTEITQEIEDIQEEQAKQNEDIEDLKQNDAKQDELIQKLKDNSINVTTEEATSLQVQDASTLPAKLEVRGNHSQETREGYNLWDYLNVVKASVGGLTIEKDYENGYIIVNGTPNENYVYISSSIFITDMLEDGQRYTLWQEIYGGEGTTDGIYLQVTRTADNETTVRYYSRNNSASFLVDKSNNASYSITLQTSSVDGTGTLTNYKNRYMLYKGTDEKSYELPGASPSINYPSEVRIVGDNVNMFNVWESGTISNSGNIESSDIAIRTADFISVKSNTSYTYKIYDETISNIALFEYDENSNFIKVMYNLNTEQTIVTSETTRKVKMRIVSTDLSTKMKFEEGTEATSYSPYGQGSVEVKKINKNYYDVGKSINDYFVTAGSKGATITQYNASNYVECDIIEGIMNIETYNTSGWNWIAKWLKINKNTNYTISLNKSTTSLTVLGFNSVETGITGDVIAELGSTNSKTTFNSGNYEYYAVSFYPPAGLEIAIQVEAGDLNTNFEEHQEQSYILDIQKPMLLGDYFVKEADGWKEVHIWNKLIFTGQENWNKSGASTDEIFVTTLDIENGVDGYGYSNYFRYYGYVEIGCFSVYNNGANIRFCVDSSVISDINRFKTMLADKYASGDSVYVYYKLSTPNKLACTEAQSNILDQLNELELFKGTNNIITAESLALMQMQYIADTETYIDNRIDEKLANINQQLLEIVGGN